MNRVVGVPDLVSSVINTYFGEESYWALHELVFRDDYPGYKPTVVEIPNGDGKADAQKKYAHVAPKYFANIWQQKALEPYLDRAFYAAYEMGKRLGLPQKYLPKKEYGALRVLDYPPGAVSNPHEDFDLFTLMLYRDDPSKFRVLEHPPELEIGFDGVARHKPPKENLLLNVAQAINPQCHFGQLGTEIGMGPATPHEVVASDRSQHSIVYFAICDHNVALPSGVLVRDWLNERMSRSRTEFKKYE